MLHIVAGYDRTTAHAHATAAEARECEANTLWEDAEPASCPICDAYGCGGARGAGCDRYERNDRVRWEDEADDAWALALEAMEV